MLGYARLASQLSEFKSMARQQPRHSELTRHEMRLESNLRKFEMQNRDILSKIAEQDMAELRPSLSRQTPPITSEAHRSKSSLLQNSGYFGRFEAYSGRGSGPQSGRGLSKRDAAANDGRTLPEGRLSDGAQMLRQLIQDYR